MNLAIEEYLFQTSNEDIFILWQNEPVVVIGKNQNVYAEINFDYLNENKIKIARRITGGGAVYHDSGNVNYTFISNKESDGIDFAYFTSPIISALRDLGINAELSGRNDLVVDGQKFSGNAQYSKNGRVLHHGTILFDSDLSVLSSVLRVDPEKIKAKALKSVRSRVTNIKPLISKSMSVGEFINYVSEYVKAHFNAETIEPPSNEEIEMLYNRNSSSEWIFPKREFLADYNVYRKHKFDFGIVCADLKMSGEIIVDVKIYGDFFGNGEISELESALKNNNINNLELTLKNLSVNNYINKMTNAEFLAYLLDR